MHKTCDEMFLSMNKNETTRGDEIQSELIKLYREAGPVWEGSNQT